MKILREIRHSEIVPGEIDKDPSEFSHRRAARAIVTDADGKVALLYVGKHQYHKLPGGGIEEGEAVIAALERELLEEIGCTAEITGELGAIIEYRDAWNMMQTSYCYRATQVGKKQQPAFTDKELSEGFQIVWADTMAQAIHLLQQDAPQEYGGKIIRERDLTFLKTASQRTK